VHKLCECRCGKEVTNEKNRFLRGHSGRGKHCSNEHKEKISQSHIGKSPGNKGMIYSEKIRKKFSDSHIGIPSGFKGKHQTPEVRKKLSDLYTGKLSSFKGKYHTEKSKLKNSLAHIGKKLSPDTIAKMKGKKHSLEQRKKQSISMKRYLEINGAVCFGEGKNEKYIFDLIEKVLNIKIYRNHWCISFLIDRKSIDGFLFEYNLAIEVIESNNHHKLKSDGQLSDYDQIRQSIIAGKLHCMIYYISDQEFLKNPEKEIYRLKDFLKMLDEGKN